MRAGGRPPERRNYAKRPIGGRLRRRYWKEFGALLAMSANLKEEIASAGDCQAKIAERSQPGAGQDVWHEPEISLQLSPCPEDSGNFDGKTSSAGFRVSTLAAVPVSWGKRMCTMALAFVGAPVAASPCGARTTTTQIAAIADTRNTRQRNPGRGDSRIYSLILLFRIMCGSWNKHIELERIVLIAGTWIKVH